MTGPNGLQEKMVKSVSTWDFEFDDKFEFKALEHKHDVKCDEWNAKCT